MVNPVGQMSIYAALNASQTPIRNFLVSTYHLLVIHTGRYPAEDVSPVDEVELEDYELIVSSITQEDAPSRLTSPSLDVFVAWLYGMEVGQPATQLVTVTVEVVELMTYQVFEGVLRVEVTGQVVTVI